jgi:hypothetical protein
MKEYTGTEVWDDEEVPTVREHHTSSKMLVAADQAEKLARVLAEGEELVGPGSTVKAAPRAAGGQQ